ncbi:MAG TPA: YihY/virulence factor BrkB family protein [Streptomyces sp.]|uniref:YihY/virulence factor BrkB family protein n=1 Tax=Streptomyces sp. TaxID=1931 RepID=UPI002D569A6A|nr:YihY/virulence factor BrkB family protein [Streptomyces sp.]HZG05879.1 YihY/virulence factor BrkB family protein [Streptomyces sp.]
MAKHKIRQHQQEGADRPPETPARLPGKSWWGVLKRTVAEFRDDNLTDWGAALTYYGVLSIFPALLALVSVLGVIGRSAIQPLIDNVATLAPGPVRDILVSMLRQLQNNQGGAGIALVIGVALAVWSASGYVAAFMRASNAVYDIEEGRPIWKKLPVRVGVTVALLVILALSSFAVVLTGDLARRAGDLVGLGNTAVTVWNIAKWPALVVLVSLMIALLYWAAPNVRHGGFRWISPGSFLAVLLWIAASAGFAFYVANFGSYNKTYGSLAGVIIFLIWLWITNIVILLGQEFDAEMQRGRAIRAGHPADEEPYVEPRDTRAFSSGSPGSPDDGPDRRG